MKAGGLARLLKKLGIPVEGDSTVQYALLIQYFRRRGVKDFMQLVGAIPLDFKIEEKASGSSPGHAPAAVPPTPFTPPAPVTKPSVPAPEQAKKPLQVVTKLQGLEQPKPRPEPRPIPMEAPKTPRRFVPDPAAIAARKSPYDVVDPEGYPAGPLLPAPAPDPSTLDAKAPSWDASKPNDPTGTWPQVERRSGKERRHHPDRRKDVDMVFKNRRYGKDRRDPNERRKGWPPGGHVK